MYKKRLNGCIHQHEQYLFGKPSKKEALLFQVLVFFLIEI
jgi:hypothetical protein